MQFDFGSNWESFSRNALTSERIKRARADFAALMGDIDIAGRSFLNIGFGQGLSLLIAEESGAKVVGCDISPKCREVLQRNRAMFPGLDQALEPSIVIGSILDEATVNKLKILQPGPADGYYIVHSWGVLHHTGNMHQAPHHAASLVRNGGYLVLALYNRHWSSPIWKQVKRLYCVSPKWMEAICICVLYPVILAAKMIATRRNPFLMERGMDFFYDVIDWVGG
jgi:2-polyprenyl-3-methyl-5-hydroxy-6-metoxy-1,4-benzoquinol methylase